MKKDVISQRVQDAFVVMCITDDKILRICRDAIPTNYFAATLTQDIISICYTYFDQFASAPKNNFQDELFRFLDGKEDRIKNQYTTYVSRLAELDYPTDKYVLSRIDEYVQAKTFQSAALQFIEEVQGGDFVRAREIMQHALNVGLPAEQKHIDYFGTEIPTYYADGGPKQIILPTGFGIIDARIGGFCRGEFVCVFAGYKTGKSWCGCHFGREALMYGRKVLHITHELSDTDTEARYDMMIGSLVSSATPQYVTFEELDDAGNLIDRTEHEVNTIYNLDAVRSARNTIRRFGGRLIIKKYPMGTCTIGELDRYLDWLENNMGYVPDVIINDYVEKMNLPLPHETLRNRINQAYIDHKRIADERNIVVITMSQIKTQYLEKKMVTQAGAGSDDARKLGNIDIGISLTRSRQQAAANRINAWVMVARGKEDGFGCTASMNYKIGQLCLKCWPLEESRAAAAAAAGMEEEE